MTITGKMRARSMAQKLINECEITKPPVPVEFVAESIGAHIQFVELDDELSGMAFIKDGELNIGVNRGHPKNRRRFTIAHEIGHLILHRDRIGDAVHVDKKHRVLHRDSASAAGIDLMEIEANTFAAELLMPKSLIPTDDIAQIDINDDGEEKEKIDALAKCFQVSETAMRYRLLSLFSE